MAGILILADRADLHAVAVERQLEAMGCSVMFWQTRHLLAEQKLVYRSNSLRDIRLTTDADASAINLSDVDSLWVRRIADVRPRPAAQAWIESVMERETNRAMRGLLRSLPCFKVNEPDRQDEALYKVWQLEVARECGFLIPDTLVTNSPEEVRQFYEQHKGNIIYKLIDEGTAALLPGHRNPSGIFTTPVAQSDLDELDSTGYCLHLFQGLIEKAFDVRLTVIGSRIFGAKILSSGGRGKIDFRLDYSVPVENFAVSSTLEELTLKLMKRMGLTFGCVDLAVDNTGSVYFFEINPQGQFLWIEDAVGHSLSFELAKLLKIAEL